MPPLSVCSHRATELSGAYSVLCWSASATKSSPGKVCGSPAKHDGRLLAPCSCSSERPFLEAIFWATRHACHGSVRGGSSPGTSSSTILLRVTPRSPRGRTRVEGFGGKAAQNPGAALSCHLTAPREKFSETSRLVLPGAGLRVLSLRILPGAESVSVDGEKNL